MSSANGSSNGATSGAPAASTKKEKRPSDKDLDLNNSNRGVWLVKVPKYIADRWESAADGSDVGKLRITRRGGAAKPAVAFSLDDSIVAPRKDGDASASGPSSAAGSTNKQIPKEHKFVVGTVAAQTLAVFSHTSGDPTALIPTPDRLCLEGRVVQRAECRPISDGVYLSIKKEAIMKAIEPERQTLQLKGPVATYKPRSNHIANKLFEARKKEQGKKARDDKEKVMETLFALFEKHQYYNIKDLVEETRQPVLYLKEILKEVCHYNLKNPHKNMWELKPEYRHYKVDDVKKEESKDDDSSDDD